MSKAIFELAQRDIIVHNTFRAMYPEFLRKNCHSMSADLFCDIDKAAYIAVLEQSVIALSDTNKKLTEALRQRTEDYRHVLETGGLNVVLHVEESKLQPELREQYYEEYLSRRRNRNV